MKTKSQKQEELKRAEGLLEESKFLAFAELSEVPAEDVRKLRRAARDAGAGILMIKKRLLGLILKNRGVDYDMGQYKSSIATVFSPDMEKGSGVIYKFFSGLGENKEEKAANVKKILGGLDLQKKEGIEASKVVAIGQLPPREILISQLMGMMVAPLRSFMYILQEKAKQGGVQAEDKPAEEAAPAESPAEEAPKEEVAASDESSKEETSTDLPAEAETAKEGSTPESEGESAS